METLLKSLSTDVLLKYGAIIALVAVVYLFLRAMARMRDEHTRAMLTIATDFASTIREISKDGKESQKKFADTVLEFQSHSHEGMKQEQISFLNHIKESDNKVHDLLTELRVLFRNNK